MEIKRVWSNSFDATAPAAATAVKCVAKSTACGSTIEPAAVRFCL